MSKRHHTGNPKLRDSPEELLSYDENFMNDIDMFYK